VSSERNKALVRRYFEASLRRDLSAIDQILAVDFVTHNPVQGVPPDRDGAKQAVRLLEPVFGGVALTIDQMVAEGDTVAVRWSWQAVHQGELLGIPATGKRVSMNGLSMYRVAEGAIAEEWEERDKLGLLQQLQAEPASV
jgi:steroid delta-isomerase-like uncharacterized protein